MENKINEQQQTKIIANWIFTGVAIIIVQVLLGGITRLTGSGLSITEWQPLLGTLPPMNETEWQSAFHNYQQIAQYKYINNHFTLSNFKSIFFWEWLHRLWARLLGFVFLVPFIYFLYKKYFKEWMKKPLIILFLLGLMQAVVGWLMVKTGLNDENLYVTPISLAIHFISAMVLACYSLVFGMMLTTNAKQQIVHSSLKKLTLFIIIVLVIQLTYGAFMAGLKAATAAPTWPDINGTFAPNMGKLNWIKDALAVQFIHRTIAYFLLVALIVWWVQAKKHSTSKIFSKVKNVVVLLVVLQVTLGILTVVNALKIVPGHFGTFEWLALLHQLVGMLLLLALIAAFYLLKWSRKYTS